MNSHDHENEQSCCHKKPGTGTHKDPVCGMNAAEGDNSLRYEYRGTHYYFCSHHCRKAFKKNPEVYLASPEATLNISRKAPGKYRPLIFGALGGSSLLLIFFGIVTLANGSFSSAVNEFQRIWYWILILASGFGFQLGLFTHLKQRISEKTTGATAEVAAAGTVSTGSMVACCAHGLVNILPIMGISAAAAFLASYQLPLILVGVFSNLVGITIMLNIIKKHGVLPENALGRFVAGHSMKVFRNGMIGLGIIIVTLSFLATAAQSISQDAGAEKEIIISLRAKTESQKAVAVKVRPQKFVFGGPIRFDLYFDTHSVELNFDPMTIAVLTDDSGNIYKPLVWEGSSPGGHHLSGTLMFPGISDKVKSVKFILKNIAGVPERIFFWSLVETE